MSAPLAHQLLSSLPPRVGAGVDLAALEEVLAGALAEAAARWPRVQLAPGDFLSHLASHLPAGPAALPGLHLADVFLAAACVRAVPAALEALRTLLHPQVAAAARRVEAVGAEELEGMLLERLLVAPPGQRPRLASYEGRAPLAAWLKVAAVRLALNQQRDAPPEEAADAEVLAARAAATDVELEVLLARHRADFQQAVSAALAALAPRERTLLRLHLREGVSLERLGAMYGVHKSSVSRWLTAAQARVREDTRRCLSARLGLAPASLESLLGAVGGQLEVSLSLLRE